MKRYISINDLKLNQGNHSVIEADFDGVAVLKSNTLEIPRQDGEKLISANYAPKEINISGIIKGTDSDDLDTNLDTFKKAISGASVQLQINLINKARIWDVCTNAIQIGGARQSYHLTFIPYSLTLVAFDPPFGRDAQWSSVYSANDNTGNVFSADLSFGGTAPPKPLLKYKVDQQGSLTKIICKSEDTQRQIEFGTAWEQGDVLDINCDEMSALRNGQPIKFDGVFPEFDIQKTTNRLRTILMSANSLTVYQEEWDSDIGFHWNYNPSTKLAQQFEAPATTTYTHVELPLSAYRALGEPGQFELTIQTDSTNTPSGTAVANSTITMLTGEARVAAGGPRWIYYLPSYPDFKWITFRFATAISLTSGNKYWIVLRHIPSATNKITYGIHWKKHNQNKYADGLSGRLDNGAWVTSAAADRCFRVYRNVSTDWKVDLNIWEKRRWL